MNFGLTYLCGLGQITADVPCQFVVPEVLHNDEGEDGKADFFSFGALAIFVLCCGEMAAVSEKDVKGGKIAEINDF